MAEVVGGGTIGGMNFIQFSHSYDDITSVDNLLQAWWEFIRGKRNRQDVQEFERQLMTNILLLHNDLKSKAYQHSLYEAFTIADPKSRDIHKAKVRDRLLHHAIYRQLYPFFDKTFISDSYSCRLNKGTHKALKTFEKFGRKVSKNNYNTCWILKCDIRKFFASIDHNVLLEILDKYIPDQNILWLLREIIHSFHSTRPGVGLPLGNLTSQLLVNIYMNEFDQFVKHTLKVKYYIRYADDFVVMSEDKSQLEILLPKLEVFLQSKLKLNLHPDKVYIKTLASGVDFLGWVHFPDHRVLRTATKRKMLRNITADPENEARRQSYLGLLKHGNAKKLQQEIQR